MTTTHKIRITPQGKISLEQRLQELEIQLKDIQEEKAIAYHASGDGWHDNPGWIQIGQIEERLSKEIVSIRNRLAQAIIVTQEKRQNDVVQIGCMVKIRQHHNGNAREFIFEIVGSGETNISKKLLAYDTPLGNALINKSKGEQTTFRAPGGLVKVEILDIFDN